MIHIEPKHMCAWQKNNNNNTNHNNSSSSTTTTTTGSSSSSKIKKYVTLWAGCRKALVMVLSMGYQSRVIVTNEGDDDGAAAVTVCSKIIAINNNIANQISQHRIQSNKLLKIKLEKILFKCNTHSWETELSIRRMANGNSIKKESWTSCDPVRFNYTVV